MQQQDRGSSVRVHGPALRFVRETKGRSIASVARQAGVSGPFLSLVELGQRPRMRRPVFDAVAEALDVDPRVLMAHPEVITSAAA